jgi:exopolysaccharide production protein ExoQ
MMRRWLSADVFLYAYLVMVLGCIYFLFNYAENISFSERAGESVLFRVCWFCLYLVLLINIASNARVFLGIIEHSFLLLGLLGFATISLLYNDVQSASALKSSMYVATILFSAWVAMTCTVDRFVETIYRIGVVVLIFHVLLLPIIGSAIDYDPLHRSTILGTEAYAGVFGHKNLAGSFFGLMALISLVRSLSSPAKRSLPSVIVMLLHLLALAATGAAGPLISFVVTLALTLGLFVLVCGGRGMASVYGLTMGFLALGLMSIPADYLYELVGRTSALTGRTILWSLWPHFFWQRPLLGYGYSGFFNGLTDAPSAELTRMAPWNIEYSSFENAYLEAVLEFGLLGGAFFVLIALRALWNSVRFAFAAPSRFWLAPFASLVFMLVSAFNDSSLMLHNYIASVLMFWCYFGPEAVETEPDEVLSMQPVGGR